MDNNGLQGCLFLIAATLIIIGFCTAVAVFFDIGVGVVMLFFALAGWLLFLCWAAEQTN